MSGGVYGGDEVGALVFDIGSHSTRVGYAGEDCPKADFPSFVGVQPSLGENANQANANAVNYSFGSTKLTVAKEEMEIKSFLKDSMIDDWEMLENFVSYIYKYHIRGDNELHPVLMSEPSWNERSKREKLTELMFEKFNIPAFFLCKTPVLSAFANGRSTGLILDSGATHTSAVPVHDGYVLKQYIVKSPLGGDFILMQCREMLQKLGIDVVPHYRVASKEEVKLECPAKWQEKLNLPNVTESWKKYMLNHTLEDFVATTLQVSDTEYVEQECISLPKVSATYDIKVFSDVFE